jgi:hypothetical protein
MAFDKPANAIENVEYDWKCGLCWRSPIVLITPVTTAW